ncbi:MAG: helicase-related protein, partial [Dehalococcoidia bacterium]
PLTRASLRIQVMQLDDQAQRLAWLAGYLPALPGAGIVYCLTIADCERVSEWLQQHGINAPAYHGELGSELRTQLEERLIRNDVKALVATVALGMGFDKPDLGFVVHYQRPGSVVAYYQQIGRAGRAVDDAYAILLNGREDDEIQDYFIRTAFPGAGPMRQILTALEAERELTDTKLEGHVNLPRSRIRQCLTLLEIDGAIRWVGGNTYSRTVNPWTPDENRWRQVTALRHAELQQMQAFVMLRNCYMEFIARALDDPTAVPCGRCASCVGPVIAADIDPAQVHRAIAFLRRDTRTIEPRKQWPGARAFSWNGARLNPRNAEGRILCVYGDAGWGQMVKEGKYRDGCFDDQLVVATAALIRERWMPLPPPDWITAVPSLRHPGLVADLARRLAVLLGLPFRQALIKIRETPEQKMMENSTQQLRNVADAFSVAPADVSPGPVLLVDDIVDSRWTLTLCGALLRAAGSGVVYPFALASATSRL